MRNFCAKRPHYVDVQVVATDIEAATFVKIGLKLIDGRIGK